MTLIADLQAQGLPVISVSPTNEITMGDMNDDQRRIYQAVLIHYYYPLEYPDIVNVVRYRLELKNNFNDIIVQLQTYTDVSNASLPDLRVQMKYVLNLLIKMMKSYEAEIKTKKDHYG